VRRGGGPRAKRGGGRAKRDDRAPVKRGGVRRLRAAELASLRAEVAGRAPGPAPARWNADPEDVQRGVARLVLTLVEFMRQLFERQTLRRLEAGTLTAEETEALGLALMRLEETVTEFAARFGLRPEDLNLDLGPLGRLR
jgi:hypothetical protein